MGGKHEVNVYQHCEITGYIKPVKCDYRRGAPSFTQTVYVKRSIAVYVDDGKV